MIHAIFPYGARRRFLRALARRFRVDLLDISFEDRGIGQYVDDVVSGERRFISSVLPEMLRQQQIDQPVFFDIGANVGDYSSQLRECFPKARILAFEPNVLTFGKLSAAVDHLGIETRRLAISDRTGTTSLFADQSEVRSQHATMYTEVLSELHDYQNIDKQQIDTMTLDEFCQSEGILRIALLKIDTEGHEFRVLQGATRMLNNGGIRLIQFEFNEMNVISRVFFRDFFALLSPQYDLYRLHRTGLLPIARYSPVEEVFVFQNFIAVHR